MLGPDGAAQCWQGCDPCGRRAGKGRAWDLKRPTDVLQKSHPCCSSFFLPRNFLFKGFTWEPWAKISLPIEEDFFPYFVQMSLLHLLFLLEQVLIREKPRAALNLIFTLPPELLSRQQPNV